MLLRDWRKQNDLSLAELGERIGVRDATVSRYENGILLPGRENMEAIIRETGGAVQPNDFFGIAPVNSGSE